MPKKEELPGLSHANQIQLCTLMAAHYTATRASVDDWLRRRDQYLMLYITGAAATYGLYLSHTVDTLVLYLIPALTVVILAAYISADFHVSYLCKWLKVEYTSLIEQYVRAHGVISLAPWHWDNSKSLQEFYSSGIGRLRYVFLFLTFSLANIAAPILACARTRTYADTLLGTSLGAIGVSFLTLSYAYRKRKVMACE